MDSDKIITKPHNKTILDDVIIEAKLGRGSLVIVNGDEKTGKTTILNYISELDTNTVFAQGSSDEAIHTQMPYHPLYEIFEKLGQIGYGKQIKKFNEDFIKKNIDEYVTAGKKILYFTTENPKNISFAQGNENIDVYWLSWLKNPPCRMEYEIQRKLNEFIKKNSKDNSAIFIDGLEYLIEENGDESVHNFIQRYRDELGPNSVFIPVDMQAIEKFGSFQDYVSPANYQNLEQLPNSCTLVIEDDSPNKLLEEYKKTLADGKNAVLITRQSDEVLLQQGIEPDKVISAFQEDNKTKKLYGVYKLLNSSRKPNEVSFHRIRFELERDLLKITKTKPECSIFIDSLEDLIRGSNFNTAYKFIKGLSDQVSSKGGSLVVQINPKDETISNQQLCSLKRPYYALFEEAVENLPNLSKTSQPEEIVDSLLKWIEPYGDKTVILGIDNVHLADEKTLKFLEQLKCKIIDKNIIVVATKNQSLVNKRSANIEKLLNNLQTDSELIQLEYFDKVETGDFIKKMLNTQNVELKASAMIYEKTGGNPLFIKEFLNHLVEKKLITCNDKGWWFVGDLSDTKLPEKLEDIVEDKIKLMDKSEKRVLDYIFYANNEIIDYTRGRFKHDFLFSLVYPKKPREDEIYDLEEFNHAILKLKELGLIKQIRDGDYKVEHSIIDALKNKKDREAQTMEYETKEILEIIHEKIGKKLENRLKEDPMAKDELVPLLAHYFSKAQKNQMNLIKTLEYCNNALSNLFVSPYNKDIIKFSDSIINAYNELKKMNVSETKYNFNEKMLQSVFFKMQDAFVNIEDYEAAIELNKKGILETQNKKDIVGYLKFKTNMAVIKERTGHFNEAEHEFEKIIKDAKKINNPQLEFDAWNGQGRATLLQKDLYTAKESFDAAKTIMDENSNIDGKILVELFEELGDKFKEQGEVIQAKECFEKAINLAKNFSIDFELIEEKSTELSIT